jgi:type II secretory pathway component PulF
MALKHWEEWRLENYRQMQKDGTLNKVAQKASKEAARQIAELMEAGFPLQSAEEIVLPETILLPPER